MANLPHRGEVSCAEQPPKPATPSPRAPGGPVLYDTLIEATGASDLSVVALTGLLLWAAERSRTSPEDLNVWRARGLDFLAGVKL